MSFRRRQFRTGVRAGHSVSQRSHQVLPVAQSGAAHGGAGVFRDLVHWIAARAVSDAKEPQESGASPASDGKNSSQSEPASRLDLGTGFGGHAREPAQLPAALRPPVSENWLRAVHENPGRP